MEQKTLKITNVLSDPTRFSIYQYISKQHGDVTVQEIADFFDIHANVARLHLTKLEDVKMLVSETKKTGKGGRPSRFYRLSDEVITLQFPYRDYKLLAELCLDALMSFGKEGQEKINEIGYKFGKEMARDYANRHAIDVEALDVPDKLSKISEISAKQGLNAEIEYYNEKNEVSFQIYNCIFKELLKDHGDLLCTVHRSMLLGIFEFFFGNIKLQEKQIMTSGCNYCSYSATILS